MNQKSTKTIDCSEPTLAPVRGKGPLARHPRATPTGASFGSVYKLPLTQNKVALLDRDDFERATGFKWRAHRDRNTFYAMRDVHKNGTKTTQYLHRFILNAPDGTQVDHRNSNGLDCRRSNLRLCSNVENGRNRGRQVDNHSGYKGLYWNAHHRVWHARIKCDGRRIHLGYFDNKVEAARAYDEAARKYFGEFAGLNFQEAE